MKEKSIKNLFNSTITSALKQVDMVTAPKDKAMCLAEIAKAIALTGNVRNYTVPKDNIGDVIEVTDDPIKEVVEKAAKEVSEKKNSKNKESVEKKDVKEKDISEDSKQEESTNVTDDTWTDQTIKDNQAKLDIINTFKDYFGDEQFASSLKKIEIDGKKISSLNDIVPSNVTIVSDYLTKEGQIITFLNDYSEDKRKKLISDFFQGIYDTFEAISPDNIDAFMKFIEKTCTK